MHRPASDPIVELAPVLAAAAPMPNPALLDAAALQARHIDEALEGLTDVSRALRSAMTQKARQPLSSADPEESLAVLEAELAALTRQVADVRTLVRLAKGAC